MPHLAGLSAPAKSNRTAAVVQARERAIALQPNNPWLQKQKLKLQRIDESSKPMGSSPELVVRAVEVRPLQKAPEIVFGMIDPQGADCSGRQHPETLPSAGTGSRIERLIHGNRIGDSAARHIPARRPRLGGGRGAQRCDALFSPATSSRKSNRTYHNQFMLSLKRILLGELPRVCRRREAGRGFWAILNEPQGCLRRIAGPDA